MRTIFVVMMMLGSAIAGAQEAAPTSAPPPTTPPPTSAAPPTSAPPPTTPPPATAPPVAPERAPIWRFRAGADGGFAVFWPGVSYGANFSGRFGVQLKDIYGAYVDLSGGFGFGGSISAGTGGGGVSINVADYWRLTFMGEVDVGKMFFVAFGPGVCGCTFGGIKQIANANGSAEQAAYVSAGYDAELLLRIGLGFGQGRHKFTLALENMVAFGKMTSVSQNASMNGADQEVKIGNLAVGIAPALVAGWDMR